MHSLLPHPTKVVQQNLQQLQHAPERSGCISMLCAFRIRIVCDLPIFHLYQQVRDARSNAAEQGLEFGHSWTEKWSRWVGWGLNFGWGAAA
ncbi:MAG: hypothetical protein EXS36_14765 [Pedosphaera sp.]|nr:hypothetical protein [Pedosphaera sp.]